jgi:membrane protein DedA with SNARE-associated domain/membrane-associated phospholipid phosphatase
VSQDRARAGRTTRVVQIALVLAIVAGFVVLNRVLPNIDLQSALRDVSSKLGALTYVLVAIAAFLETAAFVGLILPGETVVILGGAVAGQGETSIVLTVGVVWAAAFAGDSVSFMLGRRLGRGFILRHGPRVRITRERFARVEGYFARYGGRTIVIGRFIGLVRALAPFVAGSSGMRYTYYAPFSILGTGLWAAAFALVGYFASQSLDAAARAAGRGTLLFGIAVAVIVIIVVSVRFLREEANRRRLVHGMEKRPWLRPLLAAARGLRPPARFVVGRLTPGGLGLEFTTVLAILAVSLYVLIAYTVIVSGDPSPTPGDQTALDMVRDLQTIWLTDVSKVITELGSAVVTLPLTVMVAVLLALRRRWTEAAVLVVATAIIYLGVAELKNAIERPRPVGGLTQAGGSSFPSGHAAHAILYPWLALTFTVRLRPGMAGGSTLVAAGVVIAVLVGLSRVYLRVHYFSDVAAGWALGVAGFATCAAIAMAVAYFRQNEAGAIGDRD